MAVKSETKPSATTPKSVVMSVRVWPDVEAGFRKLAEDTGLSQAMLLSNALELLRADPGTQDLVAAWKAWDETYQRIIAPKLKLKLKRKSVAKA